MALTFLQMQDSVLHHMGDFTSSTRTKVKQWLNMYYGILWDQIDGPHKVATDYVTTGDVYESDDDTTIAVSEGGTTVTSDGAVDTLFVEGMVGKYIQIESTDPWYRIESFTSGTEIVLEDAYLGSSVTGGGFQIHTYRIALPSAVQRLKQVTVETDDRWSEIPIMDMVDVYRTLPVPLRWDRDYPRVCWLEEQDANGRHYLGMYPVPDSATLLKLRYQKNITDLSDDADTSAIPGADAAILAGTLFMAMTFKGGKRTAQSQQWEQRYEIELQRLAVSVHRTTRKVWRRRDTTGAGIKSRQVNLGPNYE